MHAHVARRVLLSLLSVITLGNASASGRIFLFEDEEWRLSHIISPTHVRKAHDLARLQYVYVQKIGSPLSFFVGDYGAGSKGLKMQICGAQEDFGALLTRKGVSFSYFTPFSLYTVPEDSILIDPQDLLMGTWQVVWEVCIAAELFPKGLKDYLEHKIKKERWGQGTLVKKHLKKTKSF